MKHKLLTILICFMTVLTFGQASKLFSIDYESQYEGGIKEFGNFLVNAVRYPADARENDRQGTVVVGFILTKDAKIIDMKVKNSVGMGCDEETIRLLKSMEGKLKPKSNSDQYFEFMTKFKLEKGEDVTKLIDKADKLYSKEHKRHQGHFNSANRKRAIGAADKIYKP